MTCCCVRERSDKCRRGIHEEGRAAKDIRAGRERKFERWDVNEIRNKDDGAWRSQEQGDWISLHACYREN